MMATRAVLGIDTDGTPIVEVKPGHSLLLSAAGGGKSTCGVVPMLMSFVGDPAIGMVVLDSKNGELAAQCVPVCLAAGRNVAVIDEGGVLGDIPGKMSLNPLNGLMEAYRRDDGTTLFAAENVNHALISEPSGSDTDDKNKYWREAPRTLLETIERAILRREFGRITPGAIWCELSDSDKLISTLVDADEDVEDDPALKSKAGQMIRMMEKTPEHWSQHVGAALDALRLFEAGSFLHLTGENATFTHRELLEEKFITFLVGDQRFIDRMGAFYALHLMSFLDAQQSARPGRTEYLLDEFTNAPLQKLINAMTIIRGFGGNFRLVAQSRSEIIRKFGQQQARTINENAITKQWFGFSSTEEAKSVSEGMGERNVVRRSVSASSGKDDVNVSTSHGREKLMSVDALMGLDPGEQIIHMKDVGWVRCRKVRQNMISPYAYDLGANPLEGAQFAPDIRVRLPVPADYTGKAPASAQKKKTGWFR